MLTIEIHTVPHNCQPYNTAGMWKWDGDRLSITVSSLGDWRHEALVGIHEAIEALLCREHEVTGLQVDEFDMTFKGDGEPGDDKQAPYYYEHQVATGFERILAAELCVDWHEYESVCEAFA